MLVRCGCRSQHALESLGAQQHHPSSDTPPRPRPRSCLNLLLAPMRPAPSPLSRTARTLSLPSSHSRHERCSRRQRASQPDVNNCGSLNRETWGRKVKRRMSNPCMTQFALGQLTSPKSFAPAPFCNVRAVGFVHAPCVPMHGLSYALVAINDSVDCQSCAMKF